MFSKYNLELKIAGIMVVALVISSLLSNTVFLANTPRINKPFLAKVIALPGVMLNNTTQFVASLFKPSTQQIAQTNSSSSINLQPSIINNQPSTLKPQPSTINRQPTSTPSLPSIIRQLSQGVNAEEDTKNKVIYIKVTSNDPWQEKQLEINGKTVTIRAPVGTWK